MLAAEGTVRARYGNKKKEKELQELIMEIKLVFDAASSFNKLWKTEVLSE